MPDTDKETITASDIGKLALEKRLLSKITFGQKKAISREQEQELSERRSFLQAKKQARRETIRAYKKEQKEAMPPTLDEDQERIFKEGLENAKKQAKAKLEELSKNPLGLLARCYGRAYAKSRSENRPMNLGDVRSLVDELDDTLKARAETEEPKPE